MADVSKTKAGSAIGTPYTVYWLRVVLVVFYLVGIAGMLWPVSFSLFKTLIPVSLLLSFVSLMWFHPGKSEGRHWLVFIFVFVAGFGIEMLGVQSGLIFGSYTYGTSLGYKFFDTPLMIGINWLMLVYLSASLVDKLGLPVIFSSLASALIMLLYDLLLEQVAPPTDMWYWKDQVVPLQNYLAWFVIAWFFHLVFRVFRIKTANPIALTLLACQFVFMFILSILLP